MPLCLYLSQYLGMAVLLSISVSHSFSLVLFLPFRFSICVLFLSIGFSLTLFVCFLYHLSFAGVQFNLLRSMMVLTSTHRRAGVSVLAFYSDDHSSNHVEVYLQFYVKLSEKNENKRKRER